MPAEINIASEFYILFVRQFKWILWLWIVFTVGYTMIVFDGYSDRGAYGFLGVVFSMMATTGSTIGMSIRGTILVNKRESIIAGETLMK